MTKPNPKLSVILAMTPRSGSYLLCDLLHATGQVPLADEWLTDTGLDERRMAYGIPTDTPWEEVVELMPSKEMNADGVFAIKAVWDLFHRRFAALAEGSKQDIQTAAARAFPNPRYIWVRRRDLVGQCVSWAKALQNRQWRNRKVTLQEEAYSELLFSAHEIFRGSYYIQDLEKGWSCFFEENNIQPCTVYYEDLIKDPQATVARICEFLELPVPEEVSLPGKAQRDETNEEWKNRYNELLSRMTDESADPNPLDGCLMDLPDVLEMLASEVRIIKARIRNDSDVAWNPRLSRTGLRGAVVRIEGVPGDPLVGEVDEIVEPGNEAIVPIRLVAPAEAGEYTLRWDLLDSAIGKPDERVVALETRLLVTDSPKVAAAKLFFGDYKVLKTGWCELPWFGFFLDDWFPFIFHKDHGWWWIDTDKPRNNRILIHDVHMGWMRTAPDRPRIFRRQSDGHEIRLLTSDGEWRIFEDIDKGDTFKVPLCLEKHFNKEKS